MKFETQIPPIHIEKISDQGAVTFPRILGSFIGIEDPKGTRYGSYEVLRGNGLVGVHLAEVTGKSKIHGIECIEVTSTYNHVSNHQQLQTQSYNRKNDNKIQTLAIFETFPDGVKALFTFKDPFFMEHLSVGENNQGMDIDLKVTGKTVIDGHRIWHDATLFGKYDLVGTYRLTIGQKSHRVYRLFYYAHEDQFTDFFITEDGHELMHRFFIPDHGYGNSRHTYPFSAEFPSAECLEINGTQVVLNTIEISEKAF